MALIYKNIIELILDLALNGDKVFLEMIIVTKIGTCGLFGLCGFKRLYDPI